MLFLAISVSPIFGQEKTPLITIVNKTGYTIYFLYISRTDADGWEKDVLGESGIILDDDSFNLRLPYPISVANRYDIRLVDKDGDTYTKWNVLIKPNTEIIFAIDDIDGGT